MSNANENDEQIKSVDQYLNHILKPSDSESKKTAAWCLKKIVTRSLKKNSDSEHKKNSDKVRCYRGQGNTAWELLPSILRKGMKPSSENEGFSELMAEVPEEFRDDKSMFEKLVRAQHYGLPTRLLDVTLNPLVALYFACREETLSDGQVSIFDFEKQRVKFPDSDTISLICNLTRLTDDERIRLDAAVKQFFKDLLLPYREGLLLSLFRETPVVEKLVYFVKSEKPHFKNLVKPEAFSQYYFVYPNKNNRRVIAQSGAFITAGFLEFDFIAESKDVTKKTITIPNRCKKSILNELDALNINERSMFPEIEYAARYIKAKWT